MTNEATLGFNFKPPKSNVMQQMQNRVTLIGHLGSDIQISTVGENRKVARVSLATNDYRKLENGEYKQTTQWHRVVGWGPKAEQMEKVLAKGSYVIVYGRLVHRSYEDNEGKTRYVSEVVVREFDTPKVKAA